MSGDVQPRKRKKDPKKKKDSEAEIFTRKLSAKEEEKDSTVSGVKSLGSDDIQMHVHKEQGTGGHWCAKVVFFMLLAVLAGLVGLIVLENRGQSDLDTPLSESRYSEILEGWVDEDRELFDEHDAEALNELDNHAHDNEPFEEEPDHDDDDEDEQHDTEEEEAHQDEEEDEEPSHDDEDDIENATAEEEDDDEDDDNNNTNELDDEEVEDRDLPDKRSKREAPSDDDDDDDKEEEEDDDQDEESGPSTAAADKEDDDEDDNESIEIPVKASSSSSSNQQQQPQDAPFEESANEPKISVEALKSQVDEMKRLYNELATDLNHKRFDELESNENEDHRSRRSVNEVDDDDDDDTDGDGDDDDEEKDDNKGSLEQVIDNDAGEEEHLEKMAKLKEPPQDDDDEEGSEEAGSQSASLGIKIIVGVGLLVVAHQVIIKRSQKNEPERRVSFSETTNFREAEGPRKFSSGDEEFEKLEIKRRLTIVPPVGLGDDDDAFEDDEENDIAYDDELIYDDEDDVEGEEFYERYSDEELQVEDEGPLEEENIVEEVPTPQTFEELDALYKPKYEEKLTTIQSSMATREEPRKLSPSLSNPQRISPVPAAPSRVIAKENSSVPVRKPPEEPRRSPLPPPSPVVQPTGAQSPLRQPPGMETQPNDPRRFGDDEYSDEYEEDEDEEEPVSDVDDDDLMRRLEAKYGKLPDRPADEGEEDPMDSDYDVDDDPTWTKISPQRGGPQAYDDDEAEEAGMGADEFKRANQFLNNNPGLALSAFEELLLKHPGSIDALYGRASALDLLADTAKDNAMVTKAIEAYEELIMERGAELEDSLFETITTKLIDRLKFIGWYKRASSIFEALVKRFPDDPEKRVQQAINLLYLNDLPSAKRVLHDTLMKWRYNGAALVHYAYILVQLDQDYETAVNYFQEGVETNEEITKDSRIYTAWGESLQRLGRNEEAMVVFQKGAELKLYPSKYQRSLYNAIGLESQPFWTAKETGAKAQLETLKINWELIRNEGLNILNEDGNFADESEQLLHKGDWKQFVLFARGEKNRGNCEKTPLTCKMIEVFPEARFCTRGQVKFSVLDPGTHIWPHCGPTNCRLRAHLALKAEPQKAFIRVAEETRSWKEGELLIFDDSFEHEVWHNGTLSRLVLIVDIWHPDIDDYQRKHLPPI